MNKVDFAMLVVVAMGFFLLNRGKTALFFHPPKHARDLLVTKMEVIGQVREFRFKKEWDWHIRDIDLVGNLTSGELNSIESFVYRCGSKMLGCRRETRGEIPYTVIYLRDWS